MTIDEFMTYIAPKMRLGWVAMDKDGMWTWFDKEPYICSYAWWVKGDVSEELSCLNIVPVDDWTQSLRKVNYEESKSDREIELEKKLEIAKCKKRLKNIWRKIKSRCYNNSDINFSRYGGRGIQVCEEWINDFDIFFNWAINNGYSQSLSIDRIDNNGNYTPNNCRWANRHIQSRNKRNNNIYQGKCLKDWASILNVKHQTLSASVKRNGWRLAIEKCKNIKHISWSNKTKEIRKLYGLSLGEIAKKYGLNLSTLSWRLNHGWTIEEAINKH